MQLFYIPNIKSDILPKDEFIHCIKVLRHKVKDVINVTDGKGNIYSAKIVDISRNECTIQIISSIKKILRKKNIHLVIAPTKSFKAELDCFIAEIDFFSNLFKLIFFLSEFFE